MSSVNPFFLTDTHHSYAWFEDNQVLTATQLNSVRAWLEQQIRTNRTALIGMGIVCGFKVQIQNNSCTVSKGVGLTSEGDLICFEEDKNFSMLQKFEDKNANYFNEISLFELVNAQNSDNTAVDFKDQKELTNIDLQDLVGLIYVERWIDDPDLCTGADCDNKGKSKQHRVRVLVGEQTELSSWLTKNYPQVIDPYYLLNPIDIPDVELNYNEVLEYEAFAKLYQNSIVAMVQQLKRYVPKLNEICSPYISSIANADIANKEWIRKLDEFEEFDVQGLFAVQQIYDWLKDLVQAYEELRTLLKPGLAYCAPKEDAFPRHLLLGVIENPSEKKHHNLRHNFYPSSAIRQEVTDKILRSFQRFDQLILSFNIKEALEGDIKITPCTQDENQLESQAISKDYQLDEETSLASFWQIENNYRVDERKLRGYNARAFSRHNSVLIPLQYQQSRNSFYKIEGCIGKEVEEVVKQLNEIKTTENLPFDVVAIQLEDKVDSVVLSQLKGRCELEAIHLLYRNELRNRLNQLRSYNAEILQNADNKLSEKEKEIENERQKEIDKYPWLDNIGKYTGSIQDLIEKEYDFDVMDPDAIRIQELKNEKNKKKKEILEIQSSTDSTEEVDKIAKEIDELVKLEIADTEDILNKQIEEDPNYRDVEKLEKNYEQLNYEKRLYKGNRRLIKTVDSEITILKNQIENSKKNVFNLKAIEEQKNYLQILKANTPTFQQVTPKTKRQFEIASKEAELEAVKKNSSNLNLVAQIESEINGFDIQIAKLSESLAERLKKGNLLNETLEDLRKERFDLSRFLTDNQKRFVALNRLIDDLIVWLKRDYNQFVFDDFNEAFTELLELAKEVYEEIKDNQTLADFNPYELFIFYAEQDKLGVLEQLIEAKSRHAKQQLILTNFSKNHPGLRHYAGVQSGGSFVVLYSNEFDNRVIGDFNLPFMCCERCAEEGFIQMSTFAFELPKTVFCADDNTDYQFTMDPAGGVVSGPGVEMVGRGKTRNYLFNPANVEEGIFKITHEYAINGQTAIFKSEINNALFEISDAFSSERGYRVDFKNLSTGSTSYLWQFGDDHSSTEKDPVHYYEMSDTEQQLTVHLAASFEDCSSVFQMELSIPAAEEKAQFLVDDYSTFCNNTNESIPILYAEKDSLKATSTDGLSWSNGTYYFNPHNLSSSKTYRYEYKGSLLNLVVMAAPTRRFRYELIVPPENDQSGTLVLTYADNTVKGVEWEVFLENGDSLNAQGIVAEIELPLFDMTSPTLKLHAIVTGGQGCISEIEAEITLDLEGTTPAPSLYDFPFKKYINECNELAEDMVSIEMFGQANPHLKFIVETASGLENADLRKRIIRELQDGKMDNQIVEMLNEHIENIKQDIDPESWHFEHFAHVDAYVFTFFIYMLHLKQSDINPRSRSSFDGMYISIFRKFEELKEKAKGQLSFEQELLQKIWKDISSISSAYPNFQNFLDTLGSDGLK